MTGRGGPAAAAERFVHLDRRSWRPWSERESLVGVLGPDDVSLAYDATARTVTRHRAGRVEVIGTDIFDELAAALAADAHRDDVVWAGYLGYASRQDLPARPARSPVPDAVWMRVVRPRLVHHASPRSERAAHPAPAAETPMPSWYAHAFGQVRDELFRGNSYEVNLTFRRTTWSQHHPTAVYRRLLRTNPAPYAGYLRHGDLAVLSASPERFARVRGQSVETRPIKGTTPRFADPTADARSAQRLRTEPGFTSENLMVLDLLRDDLATVCRPGTVAVPTMMAVESYATVHQLVSTVVGELAPGIGVVEAVRQMFPPGSMTGAPRRRTMSIIEAVEDSPRGVYSGAMGWIRPDGRADLSVVIRTLVALRSGAGWRYEYGTGGGITVQSDPHREWAEAVLKAERLASAVAGRAAKPLDAAAAYRHRQTG